MNDQYDNLIPSLFTWLKEGKKVAIATLIAIDGGSPRPLGAQLLVNEREETLGAISSGCVEADITLAALDVINTGKLQSYNYGADSPYMDLNLPCGSSIKVAINLAPSLQVVEHLNDQLLKRQAVSLCLDLNTGDWLDIIENQKLNTEVKDLSAAQNERYFFCHYRPAKRLLAIGKGVILEHVINIAKASGLEVDAHSPDYHQNSPNKMPLATAGSFQPNKLDEQTAVLVLFHDHDWEPPILQQLLQSDVSYIGVLGSINSHKIRKGILKEAGFTQAQCQKITSPAGLIKGTRHPQHIALSMVAQAMQELF